MFLFVHSFKFCMTLTARLYGLIAFIFIVISQLLPIHLPLILLTLITTVYAPARHIPTVIRMISKCFLLPYRYVVCAFLIGTFQIQIFI